MLQSLLKRFSPYIIVAVVAYVAGHQLASQMNEEKIVTVVQDRETVRTIIKERPDGSKETIIVEDRTSDRSTVKSKKTVVEKKWLVGLSASSELITGGEAIYSLRVERYVLPGLSAGLYGRTDHEVGVSLSYSF